MLGRIIHNKDGLGPAAGIILVMFLLIGANIAEDFKAKSYQAQILEQAKSSIDAHNSIETDNFVFETNNGMIIGRNTREQIVEYADEQGWQVAKSVCGQTKIVFEKKTKINPAGLNDAQMEIVKDAQKLIDEKTTTQTMSFGYNTKEGQVIDSSTQKVITEYAAEQGWQIIDGSAGEYSIWFKR